MFITYEYIAGHWAFYIWDLVEDRRVLASTNHNMLSECAWIVPGTLDPTR